MKTPLYIIINQLRRHPLETQIEMLIGLAAAEKPHSIRRAELLSLLQQKRNAELKRSMRKAKARAA